MAKNHSGWRESVRGNPDGHCVEVGRASDGTIGVRDAKLYGTGPNLLHGLRTRNR
ncbi:DUF397 domain-containing protein [Actinomadura sp. GTD37]|uniref:DUF397 domain-containing protein n=1 Tax=Actinomadura sp. GTD37 TaxID=1778030 RepID=UPI0035C231AE